MMLPAKQMVIYRKMYISKILTQRKKNRDKQVYCHVFFERYFNLKGFKCDENNLEKKTKKTGIIEVNLFFFNVEKMYPTTLSRKQILIYCFLKINTVRCSKGMNTAVNINGLYLQNICSIFIDICTKE